MRRRRPRRCAAGTPLIEQAEALGEPPEDPLLLFSALYGFWRVNYMAFNGEAMRNVASQCLALAEKQGAKVPIMIGHRLMAVSLTGTGDIVEGREHYDRSIALYDPAENRPLATRFSQDLCVATCPFGRGPCGCLAIPRLRSQTPKAVKDAREIGHANTLMYALNQTTFKHIFCGNYATANAQLDEVVALADEKGALIGRR